MRLSFIISKQESEISFEKLSRPRCAAIEVQNVGSLQYVGSLQCQCRLASLHVFAFSMRETCAARGSGADDSRPDQI
jgi:hypothetical protein